MNRLEWAAVASIFVTLAMAVAAIRYWSPALGWVTFAPLTVTFGLVAVLSRPPA